MSERKLWRFRARSRLAGACVRGILGRVGGGGCSSVQVEGAERRWRVRGRGREEGERERGREREVCERSLEQARERMELRRRDRRELLRP